MDEAAKIAGIDCTIWRLGQIAGPTSNKGCWNRAEWFPSLVTSSQHLGVIPETLGSMERIDWNQATNGNHLHYSHPNVFHVRNPSTTTWSKLLPTILKSTGPLRVVSFAEWVDTLANCVVDSNQTEDNPAVKLLDFFKGLRDGNTSPPQLDTTNTARICPKLATIPPVNEQWMETWMKQWLSPKA